jgi:hypothetical protein
VKRALSILAVLLTVASVAHVSVAKHYCHGIPVAIRVSLTGDHASCGMEESENTCPVSGTVLDTHCCEDFVSFYGIDNTCVNTPYSAPEVPNTRDLTPPVLAHTLLNDLFLSGSEYTDTGPPASDSFPAVDLPVICQFRL